MITEKVKELQKQKTELQRQERLGQRRKNISGYWMEVIEYLNSDCVTVKFDVNGYIATNVTWYRFNTGNVKCKGMPDARVINSRVGETGIMNNGLQATIIEYRRADDIDVEFEDGVIVTNKAYCQFQKGSIGHPNVQFQNTMSLPEFAISYYLNRLGFVKIKAGEGQSLGLENYELDFYHPEKKFAIEYDGAIHNRESSQNNEIIKNQLCNEANIPLYRIRDPYLKIKHIPGSINYNLQKSDFVNDRMLDCKKALEEILTIHKIPFKKNMINFHRDEQVILKQYESQCAHKHAKERIGEVVFSNTAQQNMKIIAYHSSHNIDIQFEDGAVRKGLYYVHFKAGTVEHPSRTDDNYPSLRIGETRTMNNGFDAQICGYRTNKDIDVKFLNDGSVKKHVTYNLFKKGTISHPKIDSTFEINRKKKLGMVGYTSDGETIKIVKYRGCADIDILFVETNKLIQHTTFYKFQKLSSVKR